MLEVRLFIFFIYKGLSKNLPLIVSLEWNSKPTVQIDLECNLSKLQCQVIFQMFSINLLHLS